MDAALVIHEGQEPRTLAEAQASPDWPHWENAIAKEIDNLRKHDTYDLVEPPHNTNIVGSRFVFRIKRDAEGSITQYKARLVAQGFTQMPGIDFNETFAPVAKLASIRTILALAARYDWELEQMD
ncbi:Retrovirus-related Pol polyprotein from transposon TNT 1-94, partial [Trametes pubescens]